MEGVGYGSTPRGFMNKEMESIDAVSRALDRITRSGRFAEFTLTNGIVLNLKPVPPLLIQAVSKEFKTPEPPIVYIEEKGRDEPNPNDPGYRRELEQLAEDQNTATNNLVLAVGTSVKSVPEGYFRPEEDGWIASIEFASKVSGKEIKINRDDEIERYLCWVRFYAIESLGDMVLAQSLPGYLSGIREGEVDEVLESFLNLPQRRTDNDSTAEAGNQNGHSANRAARRARS